MTQNQDVIIFPGGGLNSDDDLLFLTKGDARYRLNVTISDDFNTNVLSNIKGNTIKNNSGTFTYPGGNLRVIGVKENKEDKASIFCIYSSSGEHSIVQYYSDTDTLEYILRGGSPISPPYGIGNLLNFQIDYFVDMGIVGNQDDKFLVLTDNYNLPHIINIQMAINYTSGSGSPAYSSITEELIDLYKRPYLGYVRFFGSSYDSGFGENNIKGRIFQFTVRLKYYDRTFSPLAPYSNFLSTTEEIPTGRLSDETADNRIIIQLDFDNDVNLVESYQLLFRNIDIGSGVASSWYIYDNYDYTSTGFTSISFYNDKNLGVISKEETLRYYDYVPDLSDHIEIIDSNRIVLGGVTEGYPNVDYGNSSEWDVSLSFTEVAISSSLEGIVYQHSDLFDNGGSNPTNVVFTVSDAATFDYFYQFLITEVTGGPTVEEFILQSSFSLTSTTVLTQIRDFVNGLAFEVTASYSSPSLTITINGGSVKQYFAEMVVLRYTDVYNTAKTGATYKYGIRYGYNGKVGFTQTSDDLIENTPYFSDISVSTFTNYYLRADLTIDHTAPTGATEYQIVSFGSNIDYYEQYLVYCNFADITDNSSDFTMFTDGVSTIIKRDDMVNRFNDAYNNAIDYGFDFQVGDKIRFIGIFSTIPTSGTVVYDVDLFSTKYEYVINSVTSSEIKLSYSLISALDLIYSGSTSILIEIVRFKNQFDSLAEEVSEVFSIDSNGYHSSNYQQQTGAQPAIIRITEDFTDCWKTKQVYINELNYSDYGFASSAGGFYSWMEKPKISLYYDSYPTSQGRFNTVNENAATRKLNKIRWGGKFLDDSGYNFMSVFSGENERILDDRNGTVNKIQQIGDTLKVYQERMTNSFYLRTTASTSADGSQTYVFTDNVMSDARQSVFEYGCTHFTSYVRSVREAYYFDIINGVVIKDTPGGPVVISDQKMHTYFKSKAMDVFNYGIDDILILGGYDEDLDMYLISFFDPDNPSETINETLGYYVPENRWISFYSYLPEYYGKISGETALTFLDGQLYVQNSNATRNNFFGSQYTSIVDIHANSIPDQIKVYESLNLIGTKQWVPDQDGDIEISLPELMQSRLVAGKFKLQEGIYRSEFLRDALVKDGIGGTTFEKSQLLKGRFLRGHQMRIRLRNDDTTEANLRIVTVKSNISE
jgi:hypothetical protein